MISPTDDFASASEVADALCRLSDSDLGKLKSIAQLRAAGLPSIEWSDLVNEAASRALGGSRRWPKSVPFMAFLVQTIRSIANEEWRRISFESTTTETDLYQEDSAEHEPILDNLAVNEINPQREMLARQALSTFEAAFLNDKDALEILRGVADGSSPEEIRRKTQMTETQYATAQKRIRRGVLRHLSERDFL